MYTFAGYGYSNGIEVAMYWQNGTPDYLTNGGSAATATGIAVSGTDVNVAVYQENGSNHIAKYWKNGNPVILGKSSDDSNTQNIFVTQ